MVPKQNSNNRDDLTMLIYNRLKVGIVKYLKLPLIIPDIINYIMLY